MIAIDTEDNSKGTVELINFFDGIKHYTFDLKDFSDQYELKRTAIEFILNSGEKLFSAHNLEYDIINIFYPYHLKLLTLFYSGRLIFVKMTNTHIRFIDSFNFSFTSLAVIGKEINLEKLETDNFYNVVYTQRDTEIVYKYLDDLFLSIENEFKIKPKMTLAGTSQKIYLTNFAKHKIEGLNTDKEILNSYYGGRCELFTYGDIKNLIFEIDINSMYPFVMDACKYPISEASITSQPISNFFVADIDIEINENIDFPIIPVRQDRLYFPVGKFKTWATSAEINKAKKEKQIKKIKYHKVYNFLNSDYIFSDFVQYFYKKREQAKNDNNSFKSNFYKRLLNAVYGRFALKSNMQIITSAGNGKYLLYPDKKFLKNGMIEIKSDFSNKSINYSIPLFVTAYSRLVLYDLFQKVKKLNGKIIYCDTDSVYFYFDEKNVNLKKVLKFIYDNLNINNKLGGLSLNIYKSGTFENCKCYLLNTGDDKKIKLKGIPKNNREDYFFNKKTTYKRPMKLRPAFKSVDDTPANFWGDFFIENKTTYKKRIINADNTTRPIKL